MSNDKLLICPYFGELPPWWNKYAAQFPLLLECGYDLHLEFDLAAFKRLVKEKLDLQCPITHGSSKIHDYRATFGLLYEEKLADYQWWGHTDFDCVYGRVDRFVTPEKLAACDIWSDCQYDYISGPFSLYRVGETEKIFMEHPDWRGVLEGERSTGWVETDLSVIAKKKVRVSIEMHHGFGNPRGLRRDGYSLFLGERELSHFHFNRTKEWPL